MDALELVTAAGPGPRVVVIGDVILDEFLHGDVERISPEAPVPVLASPASRYGLGGAANVAHNLATLGCEVDLRGVIGDDAAGDRVRALLAEVGLAVDGLVVRPGRATTHKTRVVAGGQQVVRIDREHTDPIDAATAAELTAELGGAGVVVSDYRKGVVTEAVLGRVVDQGAKVLVDPKGLDFSIYRGAHVLTPNLRELSLASGVELIGAADPQLADAASRWLAELGAEALVVTCGADGMVLCTPAGTPTHIHADALEVFDITGAGDTAIAAFAAAWLRGADVLGATRIANLAAGVAVGHLGTAPVTRAELVARTAAASAHKILDLAGLVGAVDAARARGERIVATNGCFELLHAGHVALLEAARRHGDVLVVGLNDDDSVQRLKGSGRPLVRAEQRAAVLAGLRCVTHVCLFTEDTPARFIEAVRPDVLVKGADYRSDEVVGRDFVEAQGGRLELIDLVDGVSTTSLIDRVLDRFGR